MKRIARRDFLAGSTTAAVVGLPSTVTAQSRRKNVLLLIADDLGCFLPVYGDTNAVTPNMERLAREGVYFTNSYCTSPSCSASRSVILSGLYNHATGHYGHAHGEHHFSYLPYVRPLPRLLKNAGYATGYIAKLHVEPEACSAGTWRIRWARAMSTHGPIGKEVHPRCRRQALVPSLRFSRSASRRDRFANKQWPNVKRLRLDPAKIKVPSFLPDNPVTRGGPGRILRSLQPLRPGHRLHARRASGVRSGRRHDCDCDERPRRAISQRRRQRRTMPGCTFPSSCGARECTSAASPITP